jgi:hypothetical protein
MVFLELALIPVVVSRNGTRQFVQQGSTFRNGSNTAQKTELFDLESSAFVSAW